MSLVQVIVSLCLLTVSVNQLNAAEADADWEAFKERYDKKYKTETEDALRKTIRLKNLVLIDKHNKEAKEGLHSYTVAENHLADWSQEEFQKMLGLKRKPRRQVRSTSSQPAMPVYSNTVDVSTLPTSVNWVESSNWVGPVMNQGQCGSCWSYSSTGAIEAQYANVSGTFVQMSEQNLIDCSTAEGNGGCNGGLIDDAFWYVQTYGLESLASYPDVSNITAVSDYTCAYDSSKSVTSITSWRNVEENSELALQQAVASVGPVSVGIDASLWSFQFYKSGVYSNSLCTAAGIDHAVLTVGYGVYEDTTDYWYIQNSWGTDWGTDGYFMLARNDGNMCGVATEASFPVIG
jgi:cathepsin L